MFIEEPALDQADSHRLKVLVAGELPVIDVLDRAAGLGHEMFDLRIIRINGTTGRQTTGNRGTPNAGETAHPSLEARPEGHRCLAVGIDGLRQRDAHGEHVGRVEPRIYREQVPERADHQTIADQQHER